MRALFLKLLLIFYFASSWVGATHLHAPREHHHADCKICHILKTFQSADLPPLKLPLEIVAVSYAATGLLSDLFVFDSVKGFFSHAPPPL